MPTRVSDKPPRWAEQLLRFLLKARDRETIAGDLLEEYREAVLPVRGRVRADLWYVRQVLSLVDGVTLGLVLGAAFGAWNLVYTGLVPLAEDTPIALAAFYSPMFVMWGFAGFAAYRRNGRLRHAIRVGATVAFVTFVVFDVANVIRINLFLDAVSQRSDWRHLVSQYETSGFESLRMYANYRNLTDAPFKIFVATMIGAGSGFVGGLVGSHRRQDPHPLSDR